MGRANWIIALLCGLVCGNAFATQESAPEDPADKALRGGIKWLVEHQNDDGSWTAPVGFKLNHAYQLETKSRPHVAVTALAGLALLSRMDQLDEKGKVALGRAGEFLISCAHPIWGYISRDGTRMYSHALATLFFAEARGRLALEGDEKTLEKAVKLLVETQNEEGGWRYYLYSPDTDLSVTAFVLEALGAARRRGLEIDQETFDRSAALLDQLYQSQGDADYFTYYSGYYFMHRGSFRYQAQGSTRSSFGLTAAGLASERACGSEPDKWPETLAILDRSYCTLDERTDHYFFWYGQFHGVQALRWVGGKPWQIFHERSRADLLRLVGEDGSWSNETGPGSAFATAIACLVLQAPEGGLSILESDS